MYLGVYVWLRWKNIMSIGKEEGHLFDAYANAYAHTFPSQFYKHTYESRVRIVTYRL